MRIGVVFPQTETSADVGALREFAVTAEALGFAHILTFEHVLGVEHAHREPPLWGPYTETDPFHEPLTLFSFFAGITTRIELAIGVLVLPQRQTVLVAKQAAQVAMLAPARLRLGVGVGWNHPEFQALGEDFRTRGRRIEEQVEVLRMLWSGEVVDFTGDWHRIDRAALAPVPAERIPIWFGGMADVALERAARLGDGFFFSKTNLPEAQAATAHQVQSGHRLRELVEQAGRDPQAFGLEGRVDYREGADVWRRGLDGFAAADFDYVAINLMRAGLTWPHDHIDALHTIAGEVALPGGSS